MARINLVDDEYQIGGPFGNDETQNYFGGSPTFREAPGVEIVRHAESQPSTIDTVTAYMRKPEDDDGNKPPVTGGNDGGSGGSGNPRDDMIARDSASWEAYLKQQLGSLYDKTTLDSAKANISYAQNAGKDPKTILDGIIAKEKLRLDNAPNSTYTPDNKWGGGSLTKPAATRPPTTGGSGGGGGGGSNTANATSGPFSPGFNNPYGSGSQYDDPASMLAEQYALGRLNQRLSPDPNSGQALYERFAQYFADLLQNPVFSDAEEHALQVKAFDELERFKSDEMKQKAEELAARRIPNSSGVFISEMNRIRDKWDKLASSNQNQLTTSAIGEHQRRLTQALSVLSQLAGTQEGRLDAGLMLSMVPLELQDKAFSRLVGATNLGNANGNYTNGLMSLLTNLQQQSYYNQQNQSGAIGALMELIASLWPE